MVLLQNDVSTAQERASSIANGVQLLASSGTITTDSQTKLVGNESAKEVIVKSQAFSKQIGSILTALSENIKSVSCSFQSMDAQLGKQLNDTGFSLNERK